MSYCSLNAQQTDKDMQMRLQLSLEKKLSNQWQLELDAMTKTDRNMGHMYQHYLELGLQKKLSGHIKVGVQQRLVSNRLLDGAYITQYRSGVYATLKQEFQLWTFEERFLLQTPNWAFNASNNEMATKPLRLRIKFTTTRKINKFWSVYAGVEVYLNTNNEIYPTFARLRLPVGISYKINKDTELKPYVMYQYRKHLKHPVSEDCIIGLTLKARI